MATNADLRRRAVVFGPALPWAPIAEGVERKLLEEFEVGGCTYATQLLRAQVGAALPLHSHGCEDMLVLEGELIEGSTRHAAGRYLHRPPQRSDRLATELGCTVLVKTRPTGDHDRERVVADVSAPAWQGDLRGLRHMPLCELPCSRVVLLGFAPGVRIGEHFHRDGEEFFVLNGALCDHEGTYPAGTWVRQPPGSGHMVHAPEGATLWTFAGHLTARFVASVCR